MTDDTNKPKKPTIEIPPLPEPLSPYKLHSPEVRRAHQAKVEAHFTAKREAERQAVQEEEAKRAHANRYLTDTEYHQRAIENENANRAREAQREAERFAAQQRKKEALAASPDVVDVLTTNAADMIRELLHWHSKGYEWNVEGPLVMLPPSLFHVQMKAPAKKSKAAAKESA